MHNNFPVKETKIARYLIFFFLVIGFFSVAHFTFAATLNILPSSGSYAVGDNFSATVTVDSADQATNAIDATVSFPIDKLQVITLSKDGSIINLWAGEPAYSNDNGTVTLSGVVLNPGFTGSSGKVLKINFKVKSSGNAPVVFSSGSVLANDGRGTNILTSLNGAQFKLTDTKVSPPAKQPSTTPVKDAHPEVKDVTPITTVVTHPDTEEIPITSPELEGTSFWTLSSPFVRVVVVWIKNIIFIALLILLLLAIYVLILRMWHRMVLFRYRLKNETRELTLNQYKEISQKAEEDFSVGNYLGAISGYRKLQERAGAEKQSELNEKINSAGKFLVAATNFKRATNAARRGAWQEAKGLLEDLEVMADLSFVYHAEAKTLYDKVEQQLAQVAEDRELSITEAEKKISEIQSLAQENKEKFIQEHSLLLAEKERREERERDNDRLNNLIKEKEILFAKDLSNSEAQAASREAVLREELRVLTSNIAEHQNKITQTLSVAEETKSALAREQDQHTSEKSKRAEIEEENKRLQQIIETKDMSLHDAESAIAAVKLELAHAKDSGQEEKIINQKLQEEITKLEALIKEKDVSSLQSVSEKEALAQENANNLQKLSQTYEIKLKDLQADHQKELSSVEEKVKAKEVELEKQKTIFESKISEKEAEINAHAVELEDKYKKEAVQLQKELATRETKIKDVETKAKKDIEAMDAKMKDKEASAKKVLDDLQTEADKLKEKVEITERTLKETKAQLAREQALLVAEKSKAENLLGAISKFINPSK